MEQSDYSITDPIRIWERGISKEKSGSMTDAIKYYRKALRLEPNVERLYRQKLQEEWDLSQKLANLEIRVESQNNDDVEVDGIELSTETTDEEEEVLPCWILDMLPDDILSMIVQEVILSSPISWVNLSLSCKKFNQLCFHESVPYRTFAEHIYSKQQYDRQALHLNGIDNIKVMEENIWNNDYRRMLKERPYIKFQGTYISVVNYLRHGAVQEGSSSLINPIHMITYYRYFRFYPNGKCLRLVTTEEPNVIVRQFSIENHSEMKESDICSWSLSLDHSFGRLLVRRTRKKDMIHFQEELDIVNQGHKRFSKLKWVQSIGTKSDGTMMQFSLKKEKPFVFSRVRAYDHEKHIL